LCAHIIKFTIDIAPLHQRVNAKTINLRGNDNISCDDLNALVAALANTAISIDFGCIDEATTKPFVANSLLFIIKPEHYQFLDTLVSLFSNHMALQDLVR
jgi:hypothetical protein